MDRHDLVFSSKLFKALFYNSTVKENCNKSKREKLNIFSKSKVYNLLADLMLKNNNQQLKGHIEKFVMFHSDSDLDLDFFKVLFDFSDKIIVRLNNCYCFRYKYTDIWRNLTRECDEELFVTAAIVRDDLRRGISTKREFDWPYCIEHDNHEIKMMLQRDCGVSENHFHLRGSSPYFYISWIFLMNNLSSRFFEDEIDKIDSTHLKKYPNEKDEYSLKIIWRKAAAIRLYLYCLIIRKVYPESKYIYEEYAEKLKIILQNTVIPYTASNNCTFPVKRIQEQIEFFNHTGSFDYAQRFLSNKNNKYFNLLGERYILYHALQIIYEKKSGYEEIEQMLYLYLIMKHRFRTELVQSNLRVGFYNFAEYQNRKDSFIPWENSFEESIATDTICSIIENTKIFRIELRISPQWTWQDNAENIEIYENAIDSALSMVDNKYDLEREKNFFYTLHFVKLPYKDNYELYRHYNFRRELDTKAKSIFDLRLYHVDNIASRILGIDACGEEIDCRPEVFGPVFRYLQYYEPDENRMDGNPFRQLKVTYHVGEDNYDIVDALRAIYEAIKFLNLPSGSRLGHATLLGISPEVYYDKHNNPVVMPCQVFLDNIVWMYYFISDNNILFDEITLLMSYLKEKFQIYFHKIYADDIQSFFVDDILSKALNSYYLKFPSGRKSSSRENCEFDMYHYYLSYLLRGDDPELYKFGCMTKKCGYSEEYKICNAISKMEIARTNFEASYLYYLYHYSQRVKCRGMELIEEKVPDYFIKSISFIQNYMRKMISDSGIAIETNPTSNVFISVIDDYSQHPISNFYCYGLEDDPKNVQMNISINTDDKSVFSTCLSNEYAYLLYYFENKKDKNGQYMYSRFEIMQWLDAVRRMGNEQSFSN